MIPPTSIDGTDITGATIDGTDVTEITVDGDTVFTAGPDVPTSGLLHQWDFSQATSLNLVEDQFGTVDLNAGSGADGFSTINGIQSLEFTNGKLDTTGLTSFNDDRRIFTVHKVNTSLNKFQVVFDGIFNRLFFGIDDTANANVEYVIFQGGSSIFSGTTVSIGTPVISGWEVGSTDKMRLQGTESVSGNAGSDTISELRVGNAAGTRSSELNGDIGEILMYTSSGATNTEIENYFSAKWGISI